MNVFNDINSTMKDGSAFQRRGPALENQTGCAMA